MKQKIAIVTDNTTRSGDILRAVPAPYDAVVVDICTDVGTSLWSCSFVIVDISLADPDAVVPLRKSLAAVRPSLPRIFVTDGSRRRDTVQADSLGATEIVPRGKLLHAFEDLLHRHSRATDVARTADLVEDTYEGLFGAVQRNEPLPREEVEQCAELVAYAVMDGGVSTWLDELKKHHSYTHRHSMHVTGFAVAFGLHYGMRRDDVHRLSVGALMHDIGKAQVPLKVLDKPTGLTPEENGQIRRHAEIGAAVLRHDGQFDAEVIDIAHHHHEHLDGSGYPDGLSGSQISDIVRIVAVADVFSALVDRRAYKASLSKEEAYATMCGMKNKLDLQLVRAFEPIALNSGGVLLPIDRSLTA